MLQVGKVRGRETYFAVHGGSGFDVGGEGSFAACVWRLAQDERETMQLMGYWWEVYVFFNQMFAFFSKMICRRTSLHFFNLKKVFFCPV